MFLWLWGCPRGCDLWNAGLFCGMPVPNKVDRQLNKILEGFLLWVQDFCLFWVQESFWFEVDITKTPKTHRLGPARMPKSCKYKEKQSNPKGALRRPLWGAAEGGALLFFNLFAAFGHFCWPQPVSDLTSNKKPSWTQNKKKLLEFVFYSRLQLFNENHRKSMKIYKNQWKSTKNNENQQKSIKIYEINKNQRKLMKINENR